MRGIKKLYGIAILLAILISTPAHLYAAGGNIDAELPSNDGTDAFQVKDNSTPDKKVLMHVNSSGKVGIGTTSPSSLLTLSGGDIDIKGGRGLFLTDPGNTNSWGLGTDASLNLVIGMGGIGEKLRLSSGGTLDVGGYLHTQMSGGTSFWIQTPSTDTRLFSEANAPLYIGTNGNAMMTTIMPNGNVGIGTTTPGAKLDIAGDVKVQGQTYRNYVDFTPSGSGFKWIKMRYFGQNTGERPVHIYVTRSIGWNNSTPYGGPSLELTCFGNEWHWGQQFCTALYGYHGDPGAEITHAAIKNNAGNGYNVYLRLYGGVTYRIWTADDSGYIEGPVDDPSGAPVESALYGLGHGLSIIGDAYNNLYVSGTANANTLCIQGDCKTAWPTTGPGGGGTVTSVGTGAGLTGGTITTSGTISLNINNGTTQSCPGTQKVSGLSPTGGINCNNDIDTDTNSGGTVLGTGPNNKISKWINGNTIGDSLISDDGTYVGINTPISDPRAKLQSTTWTSDGIGVFGLAADSTINATGLGTAGVYGKNQTRGNSSSVANGVVGDATKTIGVSRGVVGQTHSTDVSSAGVLGKLKTDASSGRAIWGEVADDGTGIAGYFYGRNSNGIIGTGVAGHFEGKVEIQGSLFVNGQQVTGSSRTIKKDIANISNEEALAALESLSPVRFKYIEDVSDDETLGFIAEDVPDLVATQDRKGLNPMDLIAVLTKVVQQQQKEIEELKTLINNKR